MEMRHEHIGKMFSTKRQTQHATEMNIYYDRKYAEIPFGVSIFIIFILLPLSFSIKK